MPTARNLLDRGLAVLQREFGESFTVDAFPGRTFQGLIEETVYSNTVGQGGFLPEQEGVLFVPLSQFTPVQLVPWPGMRLTVMGREWVVSTVGKSAHRWRLSLTVAHPKASDVPGPSFVIRWGTRPETTLPGIVLPPDTELTWEVIGFSEQLAYGDRPSFLSWESGGYGYLAVPEWVSPITGIVVDSTSEPIELADEGEGYTEPAGTLFCLRVQPTGEADKHRIYRTKALLSVDVNIRVIPAS